MRNREYNPNEKPVLNDLMTELVEAGRMSQIPNYVRFMDAWDTLRLFFNPDDPDDAARLNELDEVLEMAWCEDRFD